MKFYPERWLESNSSDTKEASRPFSVGPRVCIGRKCALLSNKMSLTLFSILLSVLTSLPLSRSWMRVVSVMTELTSYVVLH